MTSRTRTLTIYDDSWVVTWKWSSWEERSEKKLLVKKKWKSWLSSWGSIAKLIIIICISLILNLLIKISQIYEVIARVARTGCNSFLCTPIILRSFLLNILLGTLLISLLCWLLYICWCLRNGEKWDTLGKWFRSIHFVARHKTCELRKGRDEEKAEKKILVHKSYRIIYKKKKYFR